MNHTHLSLNDKAVKQMNEMATRNGATKTGTVESAIDLMFRGRQCHCEGRAILGWHAGSWIYCSCHLGVAAAMEEIDNKLSILADDLRTMPVMESNAESRARKEFLFEQLKAEYDSLEREWVKLTEAALPGAS